MTNFDDADPWLSDEQLAIWHRIVAALELLPAAIDGHLRASAGLTHFEYYCLHFLDEAPGGALQLKHLAARSNSTLARLSRVVTGLERRGLVARGPHPHDARATVATITPDGRRTLVKAAPGHVRQVRELIMDRLEPEQLTQLGAICERLLLTLDPEERTFHQRNAVRGEDCPDVPAPLPQLSKPALRGLRAAGISTLDEAAGRTRQELLALHGVGPSALARIDEALREAALPPLADVAHDEALRKNSAEKPR